VEGRLGSETIINISVHPLRILTEHLYLATVRTQSAAANKTMLLPSGSLHSSENLNIQNYKEK
jgi:hypothetical protein